MTEREREHAATFRKAIGGGLALAVVFLVALNSFTIVSVGSEASVESFGEVHQGKHLTGFNLVAPWWGVDEYNGKDVTWTIDDMGVPSQDKFKTNMDVSFTGSFVTGFASMIRGNVGDENQFLDTHVYKTVRSCVIRAGGTVPTSQEFFDEPTQVMMASTVEDCVNTYLTSEEVGGGFSVAAVRYSDIRLDPVVRDFMIKTKERQEAENQQESALEIANLKAQEVTKKSAANLTASKDNANARKNLADAALYEAQKEALGNKEIAKSLSSTLVAYVEAKNWDGKRSTHVLGTSTAVLVK
jgi:regulator of protease activity HflC (stomatin/prohibitin superfamily)